MREYHSALVTRGVPLLFFLQHFSQSLFFQFADFSVVGDSEFVDLGGQFRALRKMLEFAHGIQELPFDSLGGDQPLLAGKPVEQIIRPTGIIDPPE